MRAPCGFRISRVDEADVGLYICRWLAAECSGPDQRGNVLLDSYVLQRADLPLIVSDRYVLSGNNWDSHKFDQCDQWSSGSFEPQRHRRSECAHLAHYWRVDHVFW